MNRPDPPAAAISHPAVLPGPGSRSFRAYWAGEATALAGSSSTLSPCPLSPSWN